MYAQFMMKKSLFFESVEAYEHDEEWQRLAAELLGKQWKLKRWSLWVSANCQDVDTPSQGFKIHISPDVDRIAEQMETVLRILKNYRVSFKFIADKRLVKLTNSKNFPRSASAKFITIYPSEACFVPLANELAASLSGFNGPYILNDKRVNDSSVVYYRYGGFLRVVRPGPSGRQQYLIQAPSGEWIEDRRMPGFHLPSWVADPFPSMPGESKGSPLLNGRYKVKSAIHFSNSGGIYKALDVTTNRTVLIKEARRLCGLRDVGAVNFYAQDALRHEYAVLRKLNESGATPVAYDYFNEWEHEFLVEEFIEGKTWVKFFAEGRLFLVPFVRGWCDTTEFLRCFGGIVDNAIKAVRKAHHSGVVLGDLSIHNLMIEPDSLSVRIIDVESAVIEGEASSWQAQWYTDGFAPPERKSRKHSLSSDDWYALGKCAMAAILPLQGLVELGVMSDQALLDYLVHTTQLPLAVREVVQALLDGQPEQAQTFCRRYLQADAAGGPRVDMAIMSTSSTPPLPFRKPPAGLLDRLESFLIDTYRGTDAIELWPADPALYETNRWNIAYGGVGVLGFLETHGRRYRMPSNLGLMLTSIDTYLPHIDDISLFNGLSGIAVYLSMSGRHEVALGLLRHVGSHVGRFQLPCIYGGEAGVGLAALSIFHDTGDPVAMKIARSSADFLMRTAVRPLDHHACWPAATDGSEAKYGFGSGAAGIALFLGQYGLVTQQMAPKQLARDAVNYVIAAARMDFHGRPQWGVDGADSRYFPYALDGGAGIGAVLLRLGLLLGEVKYVDLAESVASACFSKLSSGPGQFTGLSGILELMTDLSVLRGGSRYRYMMDEMCEGIGLFAMDLGSQTAFPGAHLLRFSCDFGTGTAGVGMALARATKGRGARTFFDFSLPSARLFDV